MKYVIIKCSAGGIDRAYHFIFPERLTHSEVARWMQRAVEREFDYPGELYSAGFCSLDRGEITVEHGSESLRITRDVEQENKDYRILNMPEAMQGMVPL